MPNRPILVCYDYGMGGLWKCLLAESGEEILTRYPELVIVDERPSWMSETEFEKEEREAVGLDSTDDLFLRAVLSDRGRS